LHLVIILELPEGTKIGMQTMQNMKQSSDHLTATFIINPSTNSTLLMKVIALQHEKLSCWVCLRVLYQQWYIASNE